MVAATLDKARVGGSGYAYVWMAAACVLIAFGSFAGTYWLQAPAGTFVGAPIIHVHAFLFSAWTILLLSQTWLAARGRLDHHREWGLVGVSLATAMVVVGIAAAVNSATLAAHAGYGPQGRMFMIVPVSAVALFAGLFATAVVLRRKPEWHKRLMMVATFGILQAALARVFFLIATGGGGPGMRPGLGVPQPVAITLPPGAVVDLLIVGAMIHDWRTRGRPHPAYLVAGGITVAVQILRVPLSASPAWLAIADTLAGFGG